MATCHSAADGTATLTVRVTDRVIKIKYKLSDESLIRDLLAHYTRHSRDRLKDVIIEKNFKRFTGERRQELVMAIVNKPSSSKWW